MALENGNISNVDGKEERTERRKRKRWGDKPAGESATTPAVVPPTLTEPLVPVATDPKARILAMQESIRARLAAAKASTASVAPTAQADVSQVKRAKVYELDLTVTAPTYQDDSRRVVSTVPLNHPTAPVASDPTEPVAKRVKPAPPRTVNPYLAHINNQQGGAEEDGAHDDEWIDERLQRTSKVRKRHKELTFVEPGKWQEIAETKRVKELKAVASGYLSGRKAGHTIHAPTLASSALTSSGFDKDATLAPRADAHPDTKMPLVMEWWDIELLPLKLKKLVAEYESKGNVPGASAAAALKNDTAMDDTTPDETSDSLESVRAQCWEHASLSYSKTAALVQHICPIQPAHVSAAPPPKQAVLRLTKKEMKRQRKMRRQEKQRETQDLQAAGLLPAPEPRLTLRNFIQVLGDQAFLDPSQIERKVQEQMQARQQAHLERNAANKLTKEQRAAKRARLYAEDTSLSVTTAVFYVKDMSHPYHRTKLDLNAQQLSLSGCVLECDEDPSFACIIVEGGPKAIKRYSRLLLVRMKWTGLESNAYEEDDDDVEMDDTALATRKFNPDNVCEFVWQGMVVKRLFHGFLFQACETHDQARKILKAKGALHYWDQVVQHAIGKGGKFHLKIAPEDKESADDPFRVEDQSMEEA